jgi:hypothetical protein
LCQRPNSLDFQPVKLIFDMIEESSKAVDLKIPQPPLPKGEKVGVEPVELVDGKDGAAPYTLLRQRT